MKEAYVGCGLQALGRLRSVLYTSAPVAVCIPAQPPYNNACTTYLIILICSAPFSLFHHVLALGTIHAVGRCSVQAWARPEATSYQGKPRACGGLKPNRTTSVQGRRVRCEHAARSNSARAHHSEIIVQSIPQRSYLSTAWALLLLLLRTRRLGLFLLTHGYGLNAGHSIGADGGHIVRPSTPHRPGRITSTSVDVCLLPLFPRHKSQ